LQALLRELPWGAMRALLADCEPKVAAEAALLLQNLFAASSEGIQEVRCPPPPNLAAAAGAHRHATLLPLLLLLWPTAHSAAQVLGARMPITLSQRHSSPPVLIVLCVRQSTLCGSLTSDP
jgi:hypothetical protein